LRYIPATRIMLLTLFCCADHHPLALAIESSCFETVVPQKLRKNGCIWLAKRCLDYLGRIQEGWHRRKHGNGLWINHGIDNASSHHNMRNPIVLGGEALSSLQKEHMREASSGFHLY
jgi:hypothetical protein